MTILVNIQSTLCNFNVNYYLQCFLAPDGPYNPQSPVKPPFKLSIDVCHAVT